jgi:hypothetical protein
MKAARLLLRFLSVFPEEIANLFRVEICIGRPISTQAQLKAAELGSCQRNSYHVIAGNTTAAAKTSSYGTGLATSVAPMQ